MGRGYPFLPGRSLGKGLCALGRGCVPSPKNDFVRLKWRILMHSEGYFFCVLARKMLNFPPEVVIWWTLKMYVWKIVHTVLE